MTEPTPLLRMPTGILGLDDALGGGLPRGRTTLVIGSTGSGKTIFGLQTLARGVSDGEAGVFLTFEESPEDIRVNISGFKWAPSGRAAKLLAIIDGRAVRTAFRNGEFDLVGMLAAVEHRCARIKCRRIVIDGLDVLLDMIDDQAVMRREVYRLAEWLSERALTAVITARRHSGEAALPARYAFLPFLTDCVIVLQHRVVARTAIREMRILKCRGVAHSSNEIPMLVSSLGLAIVPPRGLEIQQRVSSERVSSGVERLDTMLDGGYLRGSCTLISGGPGTSKTSLAGAFAEAACARGERTLFVSFEEAGEAIVRNLASVNIRLGRFVRSGVLRMCAVPASGTPAEAHTFRIGALVGNHAARCLVIDPVSALVHAGASEFAGDAVLGLLDFAKGKGVTVLLTSLLNSADPTEEKIAIGIWTNADTWMRLSDVATAGERNRALTIVKSRGTAHSNQVRELILNRHGISLVDVYTAGGAVLMGTLRRQKEEQELAEQTKATRAEKARHADIASGIAETQSGIANLRADVDRKRAELRVLTESSKAGAALGAANLAVLRRLRGADVAPLRTRRTDRRTRPARAK